MAFFKEKRTGNMASTTAVNWGELINKSMDLSVLSGYLAEQQVERRKAIENAPKIFETTMVKLEPALRTEVDKLYEEYLSNVNFVQGRPENRSDVVAARKRNSEILKHVAQYESGIKNLEEAEKLYDEDYTKFLPTSYNNYDGGSKGLKLHNAYIDLIDGSWKAGDSDVVEDVVLQDGKVMVKVVGETDLIDANDLSPFPQPSAQVKTGVFDPLAGLSSLSIQENGDVLATESLDNIFNNVTNMKFNDIRGVLNYEVPLSRADLRSKFGGKSSISAMDDKEYEAIYNKYIVSFPSKDAVRGAKVGDTSIKNWKGFYDAATREENNMGFALKVDDEGNITDERYTQYELNEELKTFVQDWVQRTGQQIIDAGAALRPEEVNPNEGKIPIYGGVTAENRVQRIEGGIDFIEEIHKITGSQTESPLGTDDYKTKFIDNLVNNLDQITTDGKWDPNQRYTTIEEAEQDALSNLTNEQLVLALQKDNVAIDEDDDENLLNAISLSSTAGLGAEDVNNTMKSLFVFKDSKGNEIDITNAKSRASAVGDIFIKKSTLGIALLPKVNQEELSKYTYTYNEDGNPSKGFSELYAKTIADESGYVSQVRNGIFRNVLSRGMIGVGAADVILKHRDKDGLITYHAIDIFRGDGNFTANEDSGIRLGETTHIDPDLLFLRGTTRFSNKYYRGGVNN